MEVEGNFYPVFWFSRTCCLSSLELEIGKKRTFIKGLLYAKCSRSLPDITVSSTCEGGVVVLSYRGGH